MFKNLSLSLFMSALIFGQAFPARLAADAQIMGSDRPETKCTCHGGPGNYPYACAPVPSTCYGGAGYYAYSCWVCPQQQ